MATIIEGRAQAPPLEPGDRLTREEFERRWNAMPQVTKAELIDGVVYMPSAVRYRGHGNQHAILGAWLGLYSAATPGVEPGDNSSLRLDNDNEPQPDMLLRLEHRLGGQSWIDDEGYLNGAPELVAEVVSSSAAYDLHQKLQTYRRHGVREYIVWRVFDAAVDWFILRQGNFDRHAPDADGFLKSLVFLGLWLDPAALVRNDLAAVVTAGNRGLASPEHAELVARLREKGAGG